MPDPVWLQSIPQLVDSQTVASLAVVGVGAVLFAYFLLAHRRKLVPLALLVGLVVVFLGEQAVYASVVRPAFLVEATGEIDPAVELVQRTFEIGFVAKLVLMVIELVVEDVLGGDEEKLRGIRDAGFDALAMGLVLAAGVALATYGLGTSTVVPALSLLFSVKFVEMVVDLSVALAYG
jgi:hypothetical protein